MNITSRDALITIVVAVLIVNNFIVQTIFIPKITLSWPIEFRILPPGYRLQPLRDFLRAVPIAGYYTDSYQGNYWENPKTTLYLQGAQYALSPTLLDIEHCFKYDYVLFDCHQPECFVLPMKKNGYQIIYALNDRIVLAHRKQ
ncbi:MAG: hypothetical protein HQL14_08555 [Candidatus Omnitrophica bacterium]|nr:hypothetical protein [Candidatus Omnitrophota bacterium]